MLPKQRETFLKKFNLSSIQGTTKTKTALSMEASKTDPPYSILKEIFDKAEELLVNNGAVEIPNSDDAMIVANTVQPDKPFVLHFNRESGVLKVPK